MKPKPILLSKIKSLVRPGCWNYEFKCIQCGKEFPLTSYAVEKRGRGAFCDRTCFRLFKKFKDRAAKSIAKARKAVGYKSVRSYEDYLQHALKTGHGISKKLAAATLKRIQTEDSEEDL